MDRHLFYPMRFRASRPYAKELLLKIQELYQSKQVNPTIAYETSSRLIFQHLRKENIKFDSYDLNSEFSFLFSLQNMEALAWAQWSISESQLYCFDSELIEAFKQSSALDLTINNLHFPFTHMYFHFGTQNDMPLNDGELFVDGAYVFFNEVSLRIILTGQWKSELNEGKAPHWFYRAPECYDLRIPSENYALPLEEAIKNALHADIEDLKKAELQLLISSGLPSPNRATQIFMELHESNRETYKQALSLISNALCYLTAYPHDEEIKWQQNSPARLVHMTTSSKPTERARSVSKLKSLGFSIIHQIGSEFGKSRANPSSTTGEATVRTHWRRGHWRLQPYGEGNLLRKLIWITPTRVGLRQGGNIDDASRVRRIH